MYTCVISQHVQGSYSELSNWGRRLLSAISYINASNRELLVTE